jgi:hypothetical protein
MEEKYKPFIMSAQKGMIAGIILFVLWALMMWGELVLAIIPFFLLMLILPSALVLHLSSTLSKKYPDSWRKNKTIVSCLTSVLLIYAYTFLLPLLVILIISGTRDILNLLTVPFYPFMILYQSVYGSVKYGQIDFSFLFIVCLILLLAMAVAFIATRGIRNKFNRTIFVFLLACLISSMSIFPIALTLGT